MHKLEVYLKEYQARFLQDLSYVESKKTGKRVSMAQLIRIEVDGLMKKKAEKVSKETKAILSNPQFMGDIKHAQEEIIAGKYSSDTKKMFK
ncbi:MAG: hypothetical protein P9M13_02270 [Candidatus Ancaeobacter aquaticus]|nr:hypothetical protein [Candidatus Ancaeobacter aquaticus]